MAFCKNCGAQLSEGAKFCPNCGTAVEAPAASSAQSASAPEPSMSGFDTLTKDEKAQGYWVSRLVAFIIDAVIVYVVLYIIAAIITLPFLIYGGFAGAAFLFGGTITVLFGLIFVLYFAVFESATGASIGKRVFGLKVTSKKGGRPNFADAFVRNVSKIYWVLLLIDVVVGLATSKGYQQKYSDHFVGTSVTSTRA